MAAGPRRVGSTPVYLGLPEEIFSLEILVRCRAVCHAWRSAACTCNFLLAHHRHQPSLPLVLLPREDTTWCNLRAFDLRDASAGETRLQPVAQINESNAICVDASCEGLLVVSFLTFFPEYQHDSFICNPATRQIGRVPEILHDFRVTGLYQHPPTGEYRLLMHSRSKPMDGEKESSCYIFALGCNQQRPRCIGCSPELTCFFLTSALVRGNLHWPCWPCLLTKEDRSGKTITVFDTTTEAFRLMHSPVVHASISDLYEVDGTLGIFSCSDSSMATVDIWVMLDYDSEVWSHKYHVKLPVAEIRGHERRDLIVVHREGNVFVLCHFGQTLFLVDTEGKLLASSHLDAITISLTTHRIKESLVQHSFFSGLQDASDVCSFI